MSQEPPTDTPSTTLRVDQDAPTVPVDQDAETVAVQQSTTATAATAAPSSVPRDQRLTVGSEVKERFVLEQLIGKGGMGMIFKALDRRKQEARDRDPYVAMKVLGEDFKRHPDALISLQREAKKAQILAHPNIVTVYDFDRDGDSVFMTMEWLDGEPLDQLLARCRDRGLDREQAFSLIEAMGQGLAYAHKRDIVHSDFKPGNVFVTRSGEAKILDFGIARAAARPGRETDATVFDPGSLGALTPAYASCEMLERAEPDPRDDIFALACVAYELLTGRHPFERQRATTARAAKMSPAPVSGLSSRQWQALRQGLSFERAKRTATVEEFLAGIRGKPAGSDRRWQAYALIAVGIAIASATAVWFLRPMPEPDPVTVTRMQLPPPPKAKALSVAERERLEERLMVADVQLEQGRGFDPWYLYDAHRAYRDALVIDPVNDKARAGLLQSLREMRKDAERDPAFSTWAKWLEAVSDSLEVPLIASNEANVKELGTLASTVRRGMIDAIRQLVETARAKGGTDAWDKSWLAIRQALDMPPVINSPDDQRTLRELREQVAPNISPDLRP